MYLDQTECSSYLSKIWLTNTSLYNLSFFHFRKRNRKGVTLTYQGEIILTRASRNQFTEQPINYLLKAASII